jgi:cyclic pyranopterin phosphate synthase
MEDDRARRKRTMTLELSKASIQTMLERHRSRAEVVFTAGEPTLRPDLPELIHLASLYGYRRIGLITNGRRLSYRNYLRVLLEAGLNDVMISLHGHTRELHDGLTRAPGSFEQVCAGMEVLRRERQSGNAVRFGLSCVVNRRNLQVLGDIVRFFAGYGPDQVVFNVVQPVGRSATLFRQVVPRYSEVVDRFQESVPAFDAAGIPVLLVDLPDCVLSRVPPRFRGFIESHEHYEPLGRAPSGTESDGYRVPVTDDLDGLVYVTRNMMDEKLRGWAPGCSRCMMQPRCQGVWRRYSQEYGFAEFVPVTAAQEIQSHGK